MNGATNRSGQPFSAAARVLLVAGALTTVPAFAALAADDDLDTGPGGITEQVGNSIGNGVKSMKGMFGFGKAPPPPQEASPSGCPEITVLDGTGAQRIMANAEAGNAGLRYQFSISDVARECRITGNQMNLKVGVEGKVLLGPAGQAGTFDVPIRIAIVDQVDQKPYVSKLYKVAASIPAGKTGTPYTLVADSLMIPFAAGRTAQDYSIKIGIDTAGKGETTAKPARVRKPKPAATASQ